MLLHALDTTANGAMELYIHSDLQTKMLLVPLRRYPELCVKKSFVFATGDNHCVVGLSPIASTLGSVKLAALPAFHADITGRFSVKGKLLCWKTFMNTEDTLTALVSLHEPQCIPWDEILVLVGKFISQLYQPWTGISQVKELRWHTCTFRKKSGESDRLPPDEGSFYEAILRAHYQNDSLEQW